MSRKDTALVISYGLFSAGAGMLLGALGVQNLGAALVLGSLVAAVGLMGMVWYTMKTISRFEKEGKK